MCGMEGTSGSREGSDKAELENGKEDARVGEGGKGDDECAGECAGELGKERVGEDEDGEEKEGK